MKKLLCPLAALVLLILQPVAPVLSQTPPSSAEAAAYRGLHAAAFSGDVAAITTLAR